MKLSNLAKSLLQYLDSTPSINQSQPNTLTKSNFSLIYIKRILNELATNDQKVTLESVKPLLDAFAEHWRYTHAQYGAYQPGTIETQIFYSMAKKLGPLLNVPPLQIVMPGVNIGLLKHKADQSELALHEFIIAEDGVTPINVYEVFHEIDRKNSHRATLCFPKTEKALSEKDMQRVIHHSSHTEAFYKDIVCSEKKVKDQAWKDGLAKLRKAFNSDNYLSAMNVDKDGNNEFLSRIVSKEIQSRADLFNFFEQLKPSFPAWKEFIGLLGADKLDQLVLELPPETKLDHAVAYDKALAVAGDDAVYTANQHYNDAVKFCLSAICSNHRSKLPDNTSLMGWLFGAPKMQPKLDLLNELQRVFAQHDSTPEAVARLRTDSNYSAAAIYGSHIPALLKKFEEISQPTYKAAAQPMALR